MCDWYAAQVGSPAAPPLGAAAIIAAPLLRCDDHCATAGSRTSCLSLDMVRCELLFVPEQARGSP